MVSLRASLSGRHIGKIEVVDLLSAVRADRVDARGVHAALEQRERPVRPHPQPLAAIEQALARRCRHADEALVSGGLELLEVDRRKEVRVDAGDVVALDEIVGVDFPVGIEVHPVAVHRVIGLDGLIGEFRHQIAQLGDQVFLRDPRRRRAGRARLATWISSSGQSDGSKSGSSPNHGAFSRWPSSAKTH